MRCDYILCAVVVFVFVVVAAAFVCRVLWSKVKCFENEAEKQEKSQERRQRHTKLGDFCLGFLRCVFSYFFFYIFFDGGGVVHLICSEY